jgi:basic type II keratin
MLNSKPGGPLTSRSPLNNKLLKSEESSLESERQNLSIHMKITSSYSGVLNSAYGALTSPGFSYRMSSFQPSSSSVRGYSMFFHTKAVVMNKIETHVWKLVSESSDIPPK